MNQESIEALSEKLEYFENISNGLSSRLDSLSSEEKLEAFHIAGRLYAYKEIIDTFNRMLKN